jgi:phage-related tail protein
MSKRKRGHRTPGPGKNARDAMKRLKNAFEEQGGIASEEQSQIAAGQKDQVAAEAHSRAAKAHSHAAEAHSHAAKAHSHAAEAHSRAAAAYQLAAEATAAYKFGARQNQTPAGTQAAHARAASPDVTKLNEAPLQQAASEERKGSSGPITPSATSLKREVNEGSE